MIKNYIEPIAKALKGFDNNRLDLEYYYYLAWEGFDAYTYNAAALSDATKNLYTNYNNPYIDAVIVDGDIVDQLQRQFLGKRAEGNIRVIPLESNKYLEFFDLTFPGGRGYTFVRRHFIDSVLKALGCI